MTLGRRSLEINTIFLVLRKKTFSCVCTRRIFLSYSYISQPLGCVGWAPLYHSGQLPTGDGDSREATLETLAGARHMPKTLAMEAMTRICNIYFHWQSVSFTIHLLGRDKPVEGLNAVYLLLESMYCNVSFTCNSSN